MSLPSKTLWPLINYKRSSGLKLPRTFLKPPHVFNKKKKRSKNDKFVVNFKSQIKIVPTTCGRPLYTSLLYVFPLIMIIGVRTPNLLMKLKVQLHIKPKLNKRVTL